MKPLSVGNVVSAGLRIYRDNFWKYFKLAFLGYLWMFFPLLILVIAGMLLGAIVVGGSSGSVGIFILLLVAGLVSLVYSCAKFAAMSGLIARLTYGEVAEKPETVKDAQRHIKPKMWSFLVAGILVSLIMGGAIIPYSIIVAIVNALGGIIFGQGSVIGSIMMSIAAMLFFIFGLIWLISRLFLVELPLAVEESVTATSTIGRSWELTKGAVGRIQLVVFIAFLISIPIILVTNIISVILQTVFSVGLENTPSGLMIVGIVTLYIALSLSSGALMIPFWQSIKAVIYYDLRIRREGMGIDLEK